MAAAEEGYDNSVTISVQALVDMNANLNAKTSDGLSALRMSAARGMASTAEKLCHLGAIVQLGANDK